MGSDSGLRFEPAVERVHRTGAYIGWRSTQSEKASALDGWERCVLNHFKAGPDAQCRALAFRRKGRKVLIEFELAAVDGIVRPERCIGKSFADGRGQRILDFQSKVWRAGLRPPAPYTVARPICYIAERSLLLQEKAPGRPVADVLLGDSRAAAAVAARCAAWVAAFQAAPVEPEPSLERVRSGVERYASELAELFLHHARRIERLASCALEALAQGHIAMLAPSHGDLHPENLFVADDGRLTALDLDKFGGQERAADVGYFLAQTAIMGYFRQGSFASTEWPRREFLRAYEEAAGVLCPARLGLYVGLAFLQSLHYELWVFRNGKTHILEPWLRNAERGIRDGSIALRPARAGRKEG